MELAAAQGVNDAWLSRAIFAASGALPNKPEARYNSGLALAISAKAGLEPSINSIANSRLDLAAALARQDTFSPAMRVQAAGVAAEAGLLSGEEHRALYKALVQSEGFSPRTPIEVALKTTLEAGNDTGAKARTLRAALRTARGNAARFGAVSRLLLEDLQALTPSEETERMVFDFVYASLAANEPDEAWRWFTGSPGAKGDAFERAWVGGVLVLTKLDLRKDETDGVTEGKAANQKIATALIKEAKTTKQKQAVARLFVLWKAIGVGLPAEARAFLATHTEQKNQGRISPFLLESITAAAREQAGAEVVLQLAKLTNGDAYKLSAIDAGTLVGALRQLGQEDAAHMLALEATGYWRNSL